MSKRETGLAVFDVADVPAVSRMAGYAWAVVYLAALRFVRIERIGGLKRSYLLSPSRKFS